MSRARTLVAFVALSLPIGCADQPIPTAPSVSSPNMATYTVTVAGPTILAGISGSSFDIAVGINNAGDIAGVSGNFPNGRAVRWAAGTTTPVPIDAADSRANDINSFGQIVGEKNLSASLWTPNGIGGYTLTDIGAQLPAAIYSNAWGINSHGQVVGVYRPAATTGPFSDVCYLWTPMSANATTGTVITFAGLGGLFCVANDINSSGYIAGASTTAGGAQHAFLWSPTSANATTGSIQNLAPTAFASYGAAINDALQIAGQHMSATGPGTAALWTPTGGGSFAMTELGLFGGVESHAMDINDAGFVVGWVRNASLLDNTFFWQSGTFTALPPGPFDITSPTALTNLTGNLVRVVGASTNSTTAARAALGRDRQRCHRVGLSRAAHSARRADARRREAECRRSEIAPGEARRGRATARRREDRADQEPAARLHQRGECAGELGPAFGDQRAAAHRRGELRARVAVTGSRT